MASPERAKTLQFSKALFLHPVIGYLERNGVSVERYLDEAGIHPGLVQNESVPIPVQLIFRFIQLVCSAERIADIGLLVGRETSASVLGGFGSELLHSNTVLDYLQKGCKLISSNATGDSYWLLEEEGALRFCSFSAGLTEADRVQNYLYILLITINTIRQALGEPWCPEEIVIPGITSATATKLSVILPDTYVLAAGDFASFLIRSELLDRPMPRVKQGKKDQLTAASPLTIPTDFRAGMARLVEHLIIAGQADIGTAAEIVGLNTRTLQRRLAETGTSFTRLVADTRVAIAVRWIGEGKKSTSEIARLLGYRDPANFSRAFRRTTGLSPRAYRASAVL